MALNVSRLDETLELPLKHRVAPASGNDGRQWHWPSRTLVFRTTWDEVFRVLAPRLVEPHPRRSVKVYLRTWLEKLAFSAGEREQYGADRFTSPNVADDPLDRMLKTYVARGLLKGVKPPKKSRSKGLHWQLAPKGVKRLAELGAVLSKSAEA